MSDLRSSLGARGERVTLDHAEVFLLTHGVGPVSVRFDVASVAIEPGQVAGGSTQVELFEDAF